MSKPAHGGSNGYRKKIASFWRERTGGKVPGGGRLKGGGGGRARGTAPALYRGRERKWRGKGWGGHWMSTVGVVTEKEGTADQAGGGEVTSYQTTSML